MVNEITNDYGYNIDNVDIKNDFMFCAVMKNSELCRQFLERVLNISIKEIRYVEEQKTYRVSEDAKSIRLDVYVNDEKGTIYDLEMQKCNTYDLPKRARYYSGLIDTDFIKKGQPYKRLPENIILFICDFDPFKPHGKALYCFENRCISDTSLSLKDGTMKVFVNINGNLDGVSHQMRALLQFMDKGIVSDEFTASLSKEVVSLKSNEEWRLRYMTLQDKFDEKFEQGLERGKIKTLKSLVSKGRLTIEEAAEELGISVDDFKKRCADLELCSDELA